LLPDVQKPVDLGGSVALLLSELLVDTFGERALHANVIHADIGSNAIQPARKFGVAMKAMQPAMDTREDLLRQILSSSWLPTNR